MPNHHWRALVPGDIIDIVAPAFACPPEALQKAADFVRQLGYIPRIPEDMIQPDLFFSNNDEKRFQHLQHALFAEDSKAVWCLKGGYGSPRLIPFLDKLSPPKHPKLFIGFSDITALHLFLGQRWHWATLHGRALFQFCKETPLPKEAADELQMIITGKKASVEYHEMKAMNKSALKKNKIESEICGGNLCLLQTSIGTSWQLDATGKILFIEDVGERGYQVDRMLEQMRQAGLFDKILALMIGDFTEGNEPNGANYINQVLQRFADTMTIPVIRIAGIGHGAVNHPLPLGTASQLGLGEAPKLTCHSGAIVSKAPALSH